MSNQANGNWRLLDRLINVPLKVKVTGLAIFGALVPVLIMFLLTTMGGRQVNHKVGSEIDLLARRNIAQITSDMFSLCESTHAANAFRLRQTMSDVQTRIRLAGGFALGDPNQGAEPIEWEAISRETGKKVKLKLPPLKYNGRPFKPVKGPLGRVPLVDRVRQGQRVECAVFQRINKEGDMLLVGSSVRNQDGGRAAPAIIPAALANGEPNPLIPCIMENQSCDGLAIMETAYQSVYHPFLDQEGNIIGMIGLGLNLKSMGYLLKAITGTKVGKTGYVWVVGGKGSQRGRYIISQENKRDGEDVWSSKDESGEFFIQAMVKKAMASAGGEINYKRYMWKNEKDAAPRSKISAYTYFAPWDWIIGSGSYEEDYYDAKDRVNEVMNELLRNVAIGGTVVLVISVIMALLVGGAISKPIKLVVDLADNVAEGDLNTAGENLSEMRFSHLEAETTHDETARLAGAFKRMVKALTSLIGQVRQSGIQVQGSATEISASARQLEATVTEQAASTNQVTATSREISRRSTRLVETMTEVAATATQTATMADEGRTGLNQMGQAMSQLVDDTATISSRLTTISDKTTNISGIVTTIAKVADQTNLLSLNAAIEAEKAGEYGLGFTVVAREIRRLADQTALATTDIELMVKEMQSAVSSGIMEMDKFVQRVRTGVSTVDDISGSLTEVIDQVQGLLPRFEAVNDSVRSQSVGAEEISEAMAQLNDSVTQTKTSLSEFNEAAIQLTEAVQSLHNEVSLFRVGSQSGGGDQDRQENEG